MAHDNSDCSVLRNTRTCNALAMPPRRGVAGRAFFARLVLTPRARRLSAAGLAVARTFYLRALEHELAAALAAVPAVVRGAL